jgi:hypothetical protein
MKRSNVSLRKFKTERVQLNYKICKQTFEENI